VLLCHRFNDYALAGPACHRAGGTPQAHTLTQQTMESAVGLQQRWRSQAQQLAQGLFSGVLRNGRVELADGLSADPRTPTSLNVFRSAVGSPRASWGPWEHGIAQLLEPAEGCLLDDGFVEGHSAGRLRPVIKSALDLGLARCMPGEHPQPGCTRDHRMVKVVPGVLRRLGRRVRATT
jgi:hypothetical protein